MGHFKENNRVVFYLLREKVLNANVIPLLSFLTVASGEA